MKETRAMGTAVLLGIGVFIFYLLTLAPTVLWGDDAFFQTSAVTGYLQPDGGGHWIHFVLSRLFIQLPVGEMAYRVNMLSAASGALTIVLIFASGLSLGLTKTAALAGALSLTVVHTFWTHAVRAEVYTVFMMMLALVWWLLLSWREERPFRLYTAVFLIGPSLLSHQMMILLLPALALFLWFRRKWLTKKQWALTVLSFGAGMLVAIWLIQMQVAGETAVTSLTIFFTRSGTDFSSAILGFSLKRILTDIGLWLGLLGLQFFGPALVLAFLGLRRFQQEAKVLLPLLTFYFTTVLFASSYRVNDSYVFFLPGYFVIGLLVGRGWQWLSEKRPSLARPTLLLLVLVPILLYAFLPVALKTVSPPFPNLRELPGREPISFFLWPAKNGYNGAAEYGRSALNDLPPNSLLLADHTPYETLNYLQTVEGLRPDVDLVKIEAHQDLGAFIKGFEEERPLFLADDNPAYYNLSSLESATLIPQGMMVKIEYD